MDASQIELTVREILADNLKMNIDQIQLNSGLMTDLGMDSFSSIEMVYALEEKFELKIPDSDIIKAATVKDVVDYIMARVQKNT